MQSMDLKINDFMHELVLQYLGICIKNAEKESSLTRRSLGTEEMCLGRAVRSDLRGHCRGKFFDNAHFCTRKETSDMAVRLTMQ